MAKRRGIKIVNYLDDFLLVARTHAQCAAAAHTFKKLLASLGWQINAKKCVEPTTSCEFLGVLINTRGQKLSITPTRLAEAQELVAKFEGMKACQVRQLQSLIGRLNWLARVDPSCRPFLRRMINLLVGRAHSSWHFVRLNSEFRKDLEWWAGRLHSWKGRRLFLAGGDTPARLCTDASGRGLGGFFEGHTFSEAIPAEYTNSHINITEMLAALRACQAWGHLWGGRRVVLFCDNSAAVHVINKGSSRDPTMMQ